MGEQRFRALAVGLAAEDAAAGRHAHHDRAGEIAVRAVAQARRLRDDLVVGRVDVVGELDLDAGPQAVGGHADRRADDAELADRRVEAAALAVFLLQPCVQRKTPPKKPTSSPKTTTFSSRPIITSMASRIASIIVLRGMG